MEATILIKRALALFQGYLFTHIDYNVPETAISCFNTPFRADVNQGTIHKLDLFGGVINFRAPDMLFGYDSKFFSINPHLKGYQMLFNFLSDEMPDYIYKFFLFHLIFLSTLEKTVLYYREDSEDKQIYATTTEGVIRDGIVAGKFIEKPSEYLKNLHAYELKECEYLKQRPEAWRKHKWKSGS